MQRVTVRLCLSKVAPAAAVALGPVRAVPGVPLEKVCVCFAAAKAAAAADVAVVAMPAAASLMLAARTAAVALGLRHSALPIVRVPTRVLCCCC